MSSKERMIQVALAAGTPKDQLKSFLQQSYIPLPWQWAFHAAARKADIKGEAVRIGVGGARGPGKSHCVFAQVMLDDCQRVPGLKALFLRQTGAAAQESFQDLVLKVLTGKVDYTYDRSKNVLHFPNGSRVVLGGFKDERDIDKYIGIEDDLMAIEELNQLLKDKVDKLLGSLRTSKVGWRPRLYASFNPGGRGHVMVKNMFVMPKRLGNETTSKFIPSTYRQNPYLNDEYIEYLEDLGGDLGKAWRDGDFDLFEGQAFSEWNYNIHTVEQIHLMPHYRKFMSFDYGSTNPFACYWGAVDYDGYLWVYREYYMAGKTARENAEAILELCQDDPINPQTGQRYESIIAPPDVFFKTGNDTTIAEIIESTGLGPLEKSGGQTAGSRLVKAALMHHYLQWDKLHPPKLRFFAPLCPNVIRTLPELMYDPKHPEDVIGEEDHAYDGVSFMLLYLHQQKTPAPVTDTENKIQAFQRKLNREKALLDIYAGE